MTDANETGEPIQYYIRVRGKVLGPFTIEKLKVLRSRGQFSRAHEISTDRRSWQPASSLDDMLVPARTALILADDAVEKDRQDIGEIAPAAHSGPAPVGASWHYNVLGEQRGPVSIMELRSMVRAGQLRSDDFVWKDGMPDWVTVSQIPELQPNPDPSPAVPGSVNQPAIHDDGIHRTSGLAVASLVMGILGVLAPFFGLVLSLLAVIFGASALKAIARSRVIIGGRGMALTGLILGIIGLAFWAIFLIYWFGLLAAIGVGAGGLN